MNEFNQTNTFNQNTMGNEQEQMGVTTPPTLGKAIMFSFLFGLGGVVAWVLIGGFLGFLATWAALLIAFGNAKGFDFGGGPQAKKIRIPVIVIMFCVQFFLSLVASYAIYVSRNAEDLGNMGLFEAMSMDIVTIAVFGSIALIFLLISDIIEKSRKQFMQQNQGQLEIPPLPPQDNQQPEQPQDPFGTFDPSHFQSPPAGTPTTEEPEKQM